MSMDAGGKPEAPEAIRSPASPAPAFPAGQRQVHGEPLPAPITARRVEEHRIR